MVAVCSSGLSQHRGIITYSYSYEINGRPKDQTVYALEAVIVCPDDSTAYDQGQDTMHNTRGNLNGLFIMNIKASWITLHG